MAASLVPSLRCSHFVYADSSTDQWTTVTTNQELAEAFRYYCKSRNLVIEGSVADALTSFTTNTFNTICDTLGIDITALQAHLKRSTDSNGRVQFLFDQFGVTAYNRIFAEFLQNNDLSVGDSVNQQDVYSGEVVTDNNGVSCLTTVVSSGETVTNIGSPYLYDGLSLKQAIISSGQQYLTVTTGFTYTNNGSQVIYSYSCQNWTRSSKTYTTTVSQTTGLEDNSVYIVDSNGNVLHNGFLSIIHDMSTNKYYAGTYNKRYSDGRKYLSKKKEINLPSNQKQSVVVFLTTNNNTINNNTYNDNSQTVINHDGDVYNYDYDDDDPPINPPSGGGGDDTPTDPSDWGVDLPDLNIDWLLTGKENKFPFNIPFNILLTLSLLNAEPEAPHFEGTVDLGVYQWNYEVDLEQFDPVAEVCRNFEFIAFLIGLMLLTKRLIWG